MMDLDELTELKKCGNPKKKRDLFEKQLQMLINDTVLFKEFKEKLSKVPQCSY